MYKNKIVKPLCQKGLKNMISYIKAAIFALPRPSFDPK
jgi:hypothetical protein